MRSKPKQASVFQLPVHLLDDYTGWLIERIKNREGNHVITLNSEMVMLAEKDQALAQTIQQAQLVIPDGAGVIFYLRLHGQEYKRCPGIELAESLLKRIGTEFSSQSVCFFGGAPGVAAAAAQFWQQKAPAISIFSQHGYLTEAEAETWKQSLKTKQPSLILVGLGVPRQEFWIQQHRHLCPEATWIGVGGSFDIWAGVKLRAPVWLRENNLEWLYRLYKEPWRWRRMLVLPQFMWRTLFTR